MSYAKQMNVYRIKISQRIGNDIFMEQVNRCIQPEHMTDTLTLCTLYQYLSRHAEGKLLNKGSIKLLQKKQ